MISVWNQGESLLELIVLNLKRVSPWRVFFQRTIYMFDMCINLENLRGLQSFSFFAFYNKATFFLGRFPQISDLLNGSQRTGVVMRF